MRRARQAFTLVEVLIVVIVLGILAAIVIPQFTDASTDAKASSLETNKQIVRGQIELYKLQHDGEYPDEKTFTDQMTKASKMDGTTADPGSAGFALGPYLQSIPNHPYTSTNTVGSGARGSGDWYFNSKTVEFRDNHCWTKGTVIQVQKQSAPAGPRSQQYSGSSDQWVGCNPLFFPRGIRG
jgi:general secretion pathway protein G